MSMELLGGEHLDVFYKKEDMSRSVESHLEGIVYILIWVANIDAFQHWIYENPNHTREKRREAWLKIHNRFGGDFADWSGLETIHESLWHRQLHIFEVPFYYIEYGIAQIGAIGLWKQYKEDPERALDNYINALHFGGTRTLPELFKEAGLVFDFSPAHIRDLMTFVDNELSRLIKK